MLLEVIILLVSAIFIFNWWTHGYWKRRNVFSVPEIFIFGSIWELVRGKKVAVMFWDMYKKYKKHRMIGFYCFFKPMLLISDPEIVKRVLATDFNSFSNSGFEVDKRVDPVFGGSPFTATSIPVWKELRSIQAANQTGFKLKEMVQGFGKIAEMMYDYIRNQKNQPIMVYDVASRLAVDSAVAHGFGIEPKSFTDPEFSFMKLGEKLFIPTFMSFFSGFFFPWINKMFNIRFVTKEGEDFFLSMTKTNIDYRQSNKIARGDLFGIMLKLNQKKLEQGNKAHSLSDMSVHCASFYVDASATSSIVLSLLLLQLSVRQDIQDKLRSEILSVGKKPEDLDFDKINSVAYIQMVVEETLRMHTPLPILSRLCTKDTEIDGMKISKGTKVFFSTLGLHNDPEYYPEPEKFDPERFSANNKESRTKYTFIPFGEGPRICVGLKYGTQFVKTAIAFILIKYKVLPTSDQNEDIRYVNHFFLDPNPFATVKFEEL